VKWDHFVLESPFGHIFQTINWGEIAKFQGWRVQHFWVCEGDSIKAVAQVLTRSKLGFSIQYIPRGPIFSDFESLRNLIDHLRKPLIGGRLLSCRINPATLKSTAYENWFFLNGFIKSTTREMHVCTFRIDLSKTLENIWADFDKRVRTSIRKAEKTGVCIDDSGSKKALNDFYQVYKGLSASNKTTTHSFEFIWEVWNRFAPGGNVKIFNAIFEGLPVATVLLFSYRRIGEIIWLANTKLNKDIGASQLIHWNVVKYLKASGYEYYDLGCVPYDPNELPGIYSYKKNLGGEFVEFQGEYELSGNPCLFIFWKIYRALQLKLKNSKRSFQRLMKFFS